ncbi:MAG: hypothetical protein NZT61_06930 [Deltaproteobacteria bacterium]|nr:hypothetical protein [Deltaproteobacteria bacterium]
MFCPKCSQNVEIVLSNEQEVLGFLGLRKIPCPRCRYDLRSKLDLSFIEVFLKNFVGLLVLVAAVILFILVVSLVFDLFD